MDLSKPGMPSVAHRLPERVVFAGVVGAILPFLHFGWALLGAVLADPFAALVTAPGASWQQRGLGVALFLLFCGALAFAG
ncbi:hypothetical protein ACIHFD_54025 [Nonomuraea sp. NPDC051941]|uniref:hypothetical protein n=1 Tax=Nonomuraea sp. NPDC051941 TaxID=3364373 RepID=UPI0037C80945